MYKNKIYKAVERVDIAEIATIAEKSPLIRQGIFQNLPHVIGNLVNKFTSNREKDMFLTGLLGVFSGCISNLLTSYQGASVTSNLYMFVAAPAGSGKGKLNFIRNICNPFHQYKKDLYQSNGTLFIPGNITSAALISLLKNSNNRDILFETEADSLSVALKGEHGNFSHIVRNAFHHEVISISRKGDNQFDELLFPQLSVLLTGTPAQITRLIPNSEDGLFSRFNFYQFNETSTWNPLSYNVVEEEDFQTYFTRKGSQISSMFTQFFEKEETVNFKLTHFQLEKFNQHYDQLSSKYNSSSENLNDLINRNGLKVVKIAMTLTFFRKFDEMMNSQEIFCDDVDFENALILGDIYLEHNLSVFRKNMPAREVSLGNYDLFMSRLSNEFTRNEALSIGKEVCKFSFRTTDEKLKKLVGTGSLLKLKSGFCHRPIYIRCQAVEIITTQKVRNLSAKIILWFFGHNIDQSSKRGHRATV